MAVTFLTGAQAEDVNPVPSIHSAGEVHAAEGKYDLSAALVLDNIVKLHRIPPGAIPIDCRLEMDDLDSGTAMVGRLALNKTIQKKDKRPCPGQELYVRVEDDRFTISIDSSGDALYKRGLKKHRAKLLFFNP